MNKEKPWIVVFNWNDPLGRIYISEDDHRKLLQAIKDGAEQVVLDGQVIPLKFSTIVENPEYVDLEKDVFVPELGRSVKLGALKKAIAKQEAELLKRRDKGLFDD